MFVKQEERICRIPNLGTGPTDRLDILDYIFKEVGRISFHSPPLTSNTWLFYPLATNSSKKNIMAALRQYRNAVV